MTKQEAVHAMDAGNKVRHRYFSDNEWATMKNGCILFEDGVKMSVIEFWNDRTDKGWDEDWSLFPEPEGI